MMRTQPRARCANNFGILMNVVSPFFFHFFILFFSPLKRGGRTMQGVVEQYDAADRPRLQYIFYGLLFYKSKFLLYNANID